MTNLESRVQSPESIVQQWTWKTSAMKRMAVAVTKLALAREYGEFSANDLAEHGEEAQGGSGIAGTVFGQLVKLGILAPVGVFIEGEFVQRIVRNACGNRIGVWRLAAPGLARALLKAHAPHDVREPVQTDLFCSREPARGSSASNSAASRLAATTGTA